MIHERHTSRRNGRFLGIAKRKTFWFPSWKARLPDFNLDGRAFQNLMMRSPPTQASEILTDGFYVLRLITQIVRAKDGIPCLSYKILFEFDYYWTWRCPSSATFPKVVESQINTKIPIFQRRLRRAFRVRSERYLRNGNLNFFNCFECRTGM